MASRRRGRPEATCYDAQGNRFSCSDLRRGDLLYGLRRNGDEAGTCSAARGSARPECRTRAK